jgi:hypothetical protein
MTGRNQRGRFTPRNTISKSGWLGLVQKRFNGDQTAAKAYVAQLGRHSYARQAISGTVFEYRLQSVWRHPGTPEQFLAHWRQQLASITIESVHELSF